MAFIVVYDANVLYPAPLRDLLLRIGAAGIVQARWTEEILDECFRNILANRPDLKPDSLRRTRDLMNASIPDCLVKGYEPLMAGLHLPDAKDRHVLAAGIHAGAQVIVTHNLKDFPNKALSPFSIEAMAPDDFMLDAIDLSPGAVVRVVEEQAAALRRPPHTVNELLEKLRGQGLVQTVAKLNELLGKR